MFRLVTSPLLGADGHTLEISEEEDRSVVMAVRDIYILCMLHAALTQDRTPCIPTMAILLVTLIPYLFKVA